MDKEDKKSKFIGEDLNRIVNNSFNLNADERKVGALLERQRILKGFDVLNKTMTNKSTEDFIQAMLKVVKGA